MSPYSNLPVRNFWKTGVAAFSPATIEGLYRKRFDISPGTCVATAGSCFAQHIARYLRKRGYSVLDEEPAPVGMPAEVASQHGYGLFSARFANIYVVRRLLQLLQEATGTFQPQDWIWEHKGRFYDALRPSVEPEGLASADEVRTHRERHLRACLRMIRKTDVFVFTLGLTEAWIHKASGTVYASAPSSPSGQYDPDQHIFKNFGVAEIYNDFVELRSIAKSINPDIKFLLTVSPVPLTATASDEHVLVATTYSKSVLRAVAGELYANFDDIDYFPSYEFISSHFSRGAFYEPNLRSVTMTGVDTVMRVFFEQHNAGTPAVAISEENGDEDVVCEEAMLEAFQTNGAARAEPFQTNGSPRDLGLATL